VYRLNGVSLPRSSRQQSTAGEHVSRSNLQPGDLVFFYSPIHHVAIYIGNGKILHTYGKPGVTISDLNSGWWSSHYATARRVLPSGGQAPAQAQPTAPPTTPTPPTATNTKNQVSSAKQTALVVRTVNFRNAPSVHSKKIGMLHKGEKLEILSKVNAYWYRVKDSNGKIGYVTTMKRFIRQ
jgi:hypothetical protein